MYYTPLNCGKITVIPEVFILRMWSTYRVFIIPIFTKNIHIILILYAVDREY